MSSTTEHHPQIVIRLATDDDAQGLERLAELDSRRPPERPALIGELQGRLVAAVPLGAGRAIANPFVPTGELLALLRLRAQQLNPPPGRRERVLVGVAASARKPVGHARDRLHRLLERADVAVQHLD